MSEDQPRVVHPILEELLPTPEARERFEGTAAALEAAELVRTLRQQALTVSGTRGISQVELAKRTGLSQPRISQIEKGEGRDGLTYTVIRKIAHACGVNWRLVIQHALGSVAQSDVDMPVKREAQPLSLAGDVHHGRPVPTVDVFSFGDRSPLQHAVAGVLQHLRQAQPPQNEAFKAPAAQEDQAADAAGKSIRSTVSGLKDGMDQDPLLIIDGYRAGVVVDIPGYKTVLTWRPHNAPAVAAESAPVRNGLAPRDPPAEPPRVSVRQTAGDEVVLDIPAFLRRQAS